MASSSTEMALPKFFARVSDAFVGRVGKFHSVKCFSGEAAGVLSGDGSRASRKSGERLRQGSNGPHHHAPVHRVGSRAAALQGVLVAFQASKVSGSPASRFRAETSSQPFSRIQRSSTALVEATNETACQPPLAFEARRYKIHCRLSAPSAQSPETANCRSRFVMSALMPRPAISANGGRTVREKFRDSLRRFREFCSRFFRFCGIRCDVANPYFIGISECSRRA